MDDSEIIDLFWQRQETAIREVEIKYSKYCSFISRNILDNDEDVEECVSDTYFKAWNAIPPTHPDNLAIFLGTITRRLSLNRYKKNKAEKRGGGRIDRVLSELDEVIFDEKSSIDVYMDTKIITTTLNFFLENLPEKQRNVFVRRYWHFRSIEEIAIDYGLSVSNVKQILFRTRNMLKIKLEEEGILL